MNAAPFAIDDQAAATRFIAWCARVVPGYHPDTPFSDYMTDDGARCFAEGEAGWLDAATEVAFLYCNPYDVAISSARSCVLA